MSNFGELTHPVARKDHPCILCFGPIPKGEKHCHYRGMWEGEWQNWKAHNECYESWQEDRYASEEGFTPGAADMPERVKILRASRPEWQKVYFSGKRQNPIFKAAVDAQRVQ